MSLSASNPSSRHETELLEARVRELESALAAYAAAYPCPGFEIETGRTSGCSGVGGDCPTCAARALR